MEAERINISDLVASLASVIDRGEVLGTKTTFRICIFLLQLLTFIALKMNRKIAMSAEQNEKQWDIHRFRSTLHDLVMYTCDEKVPVFVINTFLL